MRKFRTSKKFWLSLLTLIGIGIFIYFVFFSGGVKIFSLKPPIINQEKLKKDKFEPASQIKSPPSGSWQNRDFTFETIDEDLNSGLDQNSCQYKVLSYTPAGQEHSSGWQKRKCNSQSWAGVGLEKWCRFEGEKACWVFVSSKDNAQNQHLPSEEKGSIKYYNIDWTAPNVGKISLKNGEAILKVTDNLKVIACSLYLDNENLGPMSFLIPGCQKECFASKTLNVQFEPGEYRIFAVCQDAAKNYGRGEELLIKENLPPQISSCRVSPSQGNIETQFQFKIEANDPDGDKLTFLWEFGDGESSTEPNPSHSYLRPGTFEPKVKVFDGRGGEASCSSAWVIVNQ